MIEEREREVDDRGERERERERGSSEMKEERKEGQTNSSTLFSIGEGSDLCIDQ